MKFYNFPFPVLSCSGFLRTLFSIYIIPVLLFSTINLNAQTSSDFLTLLNDSAGSEYFLMPQHPIRYLAYRENEQINQNKYEVALKNNNSEQLIPTSENLGMINLKKNDPAKAIVFFNKSLEANKKLKDENGNCFSLVYLGTSYLQNKDYIHALAYFNQSLTFIDNLKLPKVTGLVYSLLGQCYAKLNDGPLAVESYIRATKAYSSVNEKIPAACCYNSLGELQLRLDDDKSAIAYFSSAYELLNSLKETKLKAIVYRNIGLFHFKQSDFEIAINYFYKSLANEDQLLVRKLIKDTYLQLFAYYSFNKDFSKADLYHNSYRAIKDSIDKIELQGSKIQHSQTENDDKQQVIEMLQKKPEEQSLHLNQRQLELSKMITKTDIELQNKNQLLEEKDSTVHRLEDEKTARERDFYKQELQLDQQKNFKNLLLAISIGTILMIVLLYNRYKIKLNSHRRLENSNLELNEALTRLKQAQSQLVQNEKMASLGQLTAGIAHEIQNPLNFVNNFSDTSIELLDEFLHAKEEKERGDLSDELKQTLQKIHHHGKRADQIMKNMLLHSRTGKLEKESVQINLLCDEIADLAYHGTRSSDPGFRCKINRIADEKLPEIAINRQDVGRVLLNIFSNSLYALNKKRITTNEMDFHPELTIETSKKDTYVMIRIRDNGIGIPKNLMAKIFEPFFTTKPTGEGTGLGLSLSYDIISKEHNGKIEVDSEEGLFTEFRILLPIINSI